VVEHPPNSEVLVLWLAFLVACGGSAEKTEPAEPVVTEPVVEVEPPETDPRLEAVRKELAQGRRTVITTDFTTLSDSDKKFVREMLLVGDAIQTLYEKQKGVFDVRRQLADDESRELFERNAGPACVTTVGAEDPNCYAVAGKPGLATSGLYASTLQIEENFCRKLEGSNPKTMDPFHATVKRKEGVVAVPYPERWPMDHEKIAKGLTAAASHLGEDEAAQKAYLLAAATAFGDNEWFVADEAWAKVNQQNSKWYVRVGPDEVYFDPCNRHGGYHLTFAVVNAGGLVWQEKLDPHKQGMEKELAALAGPPYRERQVGFDLPEFIEIIANYGDARKTHGATVGQSLPNWGPVADAGGRTVAMTNLFQDPASLASRKETISSLLCPATMKSWTAEPEPFLITTVLHEAAHNLGPQSTYLIGGKNDEQIFGGPLAAMMEELKAQTAALYLTEELASKGAIDADMVIPMHTADLGWALGQIAKGSYTAEGRNKPYPQLAAIQVGWLIDNNALTWLAQAKAANGTDVGCFESTTSAWPKAVDSMALEVLSIKGSGDVERARALKAKYVDAPEQKAMHATVIERFQRTPEPSFVYDVKL